ncbi:hypothetical protein GOP47_0018307 [Adiantum capillus-veneris]|uniref:Uncharacterized protein n=1 Tax=Adiantum capillus-veneris TaxID=13818 RepID=A0A9D4ZAH2_ADICA|nr:hypothetical protein GOP47_0018307 [Adiantum capillus-veneris]
MHDGWGSVTGSLAPLDHLCGEAKSWKNVVWELEEGSQCCDDFGYDMIRMRGDTEISVGWNMLGQCKAKPEGLGSFSDLDIRDIQGQALPLMDELRLVRVGARDGRCIPPREKHAVEQGMSKMNLNR